MKKRVEAGKRGISAIVATVLIILLTVAAVAVFWVVILPVVQQDIDFEEVSGGVDVVVSEGYTAYDAVSNILAVQVSRKAGNAEINRIRIIVEFDGNSFSVIVPAPGVNEKKMYYINLSKTGHSNPVSVSVAALFVKGGTEKEGSPSAKKRIIDGIVVNPPVEDVYQLSRNADGTVPVECDSAGDCVDPRECETAVGATCDEYCSYPDAVDGTACDGGTCQSGVCEEASCTPDETPETTCDDSSDNDCDGLIDCDDSDCSTDVTCMSLESSVIMYVPMDVLSGDGAADVIGDANFSDIIGNPVQVDDGKFGGKAFEFDGSSELKRASSGSTPGINGSISVWFRPGYQMNETTVEVNDGQAAIYTYGQEAGGGTWTVLRIYGEDASHNNGGLSTKIHNGGYTETSTPYNEWNMDQWYHAVTTWEYNGTHMHIKLYIDGVEVEDNYIYDAAVDNSPHQWYIGGYATENTRFWNGSLDEWVVFDKALSPIEIDKLNSGDYEVVDGDFYWVNPSDEFTVVVMPDTQNYVKNEDFPELYTKQTQWIVDNQEALNIQFVIHEGDIVYTVPSIISEWDNANFSQSILDDAGIPNSVLPGNHEHDDYGRTGANDIVPEYDEYFGVFRYSDNSWYGEGYQGLNEHNYQLLTMGGQDYIFMSLGWCPAQEEVDWASSIFDIYPERKALFTTHGYLDETTNSTNGGPNDNDGVRDCDRSVADGDGYGNTTYIWDMIRTHENVQLVFSGHEHDTGSADLPEGGEKRRMDLNDAGKPVYQMLANYQDYQNGGDGYIRLLTFKPSEDKIEVRTYSTNTLTYKTGPESQFTLDYEF